MAVLTTLVMLTLVVAGVIIEGAINQDAGLLELRGAQAAYAADSAANMAVQEVFKNQDLDGDGTIGTVSYNGNSADDPSMNGAQMTVTPLSASSGIRLLAQGRNGSANRSQELRFQGPVGIEGFESYAVGFTLNDPSGWQPWDSAPAAVGSATNTVARTGAMSVDIAGTTDLVFPYNVTSGQWTYTAWQYIPVGATGNDTYFILMNTYSSGGTKRWSTQIRFDLAANTVYDNLVGSITGNQIGLVRGQWTKIEVTIDLGAATQTVKYNNQLLFTGSWNRSGGVAALAVVDLYASTIDHVYYDDIQLTGTGGTATKLSGWKVVAP